jgi:hypothetical protein
MALFSFRRGPQPVIVVRPRSCLSPFMKRLHVLCHHAQVHPLPVKMTCIAESSSHRGEPMAIYACPFHSCRCRQGWILDPRSGRPRRLWAGLHDGR